MLALACLSRRPPTRTALRLTRRHFVSPAFACQEAWDSRLKSPIFQKLDVDRFFFEVERKFAREKRGSAIDVDLFANADLSGETHLDQLEELLHQFRRTPQTWLTMESTHHAVVRACMATTGRTDNLMRMLDDPLNYGLFPDNFSLVLMLDKFLKDENWRDASKVGIYMMLQEDLTVAIAREMALLGLYEHSVRGLAEGEEWEPHATPPEPEPEDDVNVHVEYLPNNYHDGHFDLETREQRMGKALISLASSYKQPDDLVNASLILLGRALLGEWSGLLETLQTRESFAGVCLDNVKELVVAAGETVQNQTDILKALELSKADAVDMGERLRQRVKEAVAQHEGEYVTNQIDVYQRWSEAREREMERQLDTYRNEARRQEVLRLQKEMTVEEERLFFFERQEEYEQRKEERERQWRRKLPPRTWTKRITLKKKETVKDDYVPPTITGGKV